MALSLYPFVNVLFLNNRVLVLCLHFQITDFRSLLVSVIFFSYAAMNEHCHWNSFQNCHILCVM